MKSRKVAPGPDAGDALLAAAREVFIVEGLAGLSLRRVAERAGCTTMAVYTRFGGKDALVEALFDDGFERLRAAQAEVDAELEPARRVLALCSAYRQTAHAFPHHYALMLGRTSGTFEPSAPSRERSFATLATLVDAVEATLPTNRQRRVRATAIAHRLFAFCHGWVSLEQIGFVQGPRAEQDKSFRIAVQALLAAA